jgi:hypothetical protein
MNRRTMPSRIITGALTAGLQLLLVAGSIQAGELISPDFSLGYGCTSIISGQGWTTEETAGVNSPTTQGLFTFSAVPSGSAYQSDGISFVNRIAANGYDANRTAYVGGGNLSVPITASYTGPRPSDASSTPNYRLEVEVTGIGIWVGDMTMIWGPQDSGYASYHIPSGSTAGKLAQWSETTSGHSAASSLMTINDDSADRCLDLYLLSEYSHMVWDPPDYSVSRTVSNLNQAYTRTFTIPGRGGNDMRYGDGIEVFGRVHLLYNSVIGMAPVPEPTMLALLTAGVLSALCHAYWRRRWSTPRHESNVTSTRSPRLERRT